jgi:hypothetical protein
MVTPIQERKKKKKKGFKNLETGIEITADHFHGMPGMDQDAPIPII